jgi:Domain of unknown function (DUF1905)
MKSRSFHAEILDGHKGAAVIVPFDPAAEWGSTPAAVPAPWKLGHLVRGTLAGQRFDGWIGKRWGRHFLLVDEALQRQAGITIGDVVIVSLSPRDNGNTVNSMISGKPRETREPRKSSDVQAARKSSRSRKPRRSH